MTIRIQRHPHDRHALLLDVPPEYNEIIGKFGPARLSKEFHGYVMSADLAPSFRRFAAFHRITVIDDRGIVTAGHRTRPVECRNCGQGGSLNNPPPFCPSCGEHWNPMTPDEIPDVDLIPRTTCPQCGHRQTGRFRHCASCGGFMEYANRPAPLPELPRGGNPRPVGEVIHTMAQGWERPVVIPRPTAPRFPDVYKGRPVQTVNLPEEEPHHDPLDERAPTQRDSGAGPGAPDPEEEPPPWYDR